MSVNARPDSSSNSCNEITEKIENVHQLWDKLCFVNWSAGAFKALRRMMLALVTQSKALGYDDVSDTSIRFISYLDIIIDAGQVPEEDQRYHISQMILSLKNAMSETECELVVASEKHSSSVNVHEIGNRKNKLVYIIDDDEQVAEFIAIQIRSSSYLVRLFARPYQMLDALMNESPAAIIMDIVFPDGNYSGIEAVNKVGELTGYKTPVILMSGRTDMSARIQAIRAGSEAYFIKPVNVTNIINRLDELVLHKDHTPYKVLIVEEDLTEAEICSNALELEGVRSKIVKNPLEVIQYIRSYNPDLVLMGDNLNVCKGAELTAVIRQEIDLETLPVVYLISGVKPKMMHITVYQQGDDYLTRPIDEDDLVNVVKRNIAISRRLTPRIKLNNKIDPVTGLIKQKIFFADVDVAVFTAAKGEEQQSVFWIGIDNLESIFREVGAAYSNPIVKQITNTLCACLSDKDLITMFSDSVFCLLIAARNKDETQKLANLISEKINNLDIKVSNGKFNLKCNIGITTVLPQSTSGKEVLAQAENACFYAKDSIEKNVAHHKPDTRKSTYSNVFPLSDKNIEKGLRKNSYSLVFQPILCVGEKNEELYEALVRMLDENGDLLQPSEFLPVASKKGLMHEVDRWVIDHSLCKLSEDYHARTNANLLIKLSGESLKDKMLVTWINNCMKNSKVRGQQRIFFELTERTVAENMSGVKSFIEDVKELGCGIVLDHYGSTDLSGEIIKELPFDFVKIHSAAINELVNDESIRIKYEGLIQTALTHCDDVIVGAVENPYNLSLIMSWGVHYVQGYFIQPPHEDLLFDFENNVM